jgi:hypothetical protein
LRVAVQLELGLDVVRSYKRLAYTPWHALAEFVDNSTQSYADNRELLDQEFAAKGGQLEVSIVLDTTGDGQIRVVDNAMGMSLLELQHALKVGAPPANPTGRSKYGLGMKTAACWYGDFWTIRTKRLGEDVEHQIEIDVERVANGDQELPYSQKENRDPSDHYTIIEITKLNRVPQGRTRGKIKDYLRSMYRVDLKSGTLVLKWQGEELAWDPDDNFVQAQDGSPYRKPFDFEVEGKPVSGWVGVLDRGSRAKAGFSILHANRVIKGWPDSWRPESLYGAQPGGSNDLVNQRLTGEIDLSAFDVSHTKDDILWMGDDEDQVQQKLKEECAEYREVAASRRRLTPTRAPSDLEVRAAVEELQAELSSNEMVDLLSITSVPPPDVVAAEMRTLMQTIDPTEPTFSAKVEATSGTVAILGYLTWETSMNDPYVISESTHPDRVLVIINMQHPHIQQITGAEGLLNYFRHCTYDALAEWQARHRASSLDPDTVKLLKDRLLRVPMEMEMHNRA